LYLWKQQWIWVTEDRADRAVVACRARDAGGAIVDGTTQGLR
jgi:hypothetical protein